MATQSSIFYLRSSILDPRSSIFDPRSSIAGKLPFDHEIISRAADEGMDGEARNLIAVTLAWNLGKRRKAAIRLKWRPNTVIRPVNHTVGVGAKIARSAGIRGLGPTTIVIGILGLRQRGGQDYYSEGSEPGYRRFHGDSFVREIPFNGEAKVTFPGKPNP